MSFEPKQYMKINEAASENPNDDNINETNETSYVFYPNPANRGDIVSINANTYVKGIVLTNTLGERVKYNQSIKQLEINHE